MIHSYNIYPNRSVISYVHIFYYCKYLGVYIDKRCPNYLHTITILIIIPIAIGTMPLHTHFNTNYNQKNIITLVRISLIIACLT